MQCSKWNWEEIQKAHDSGMSWREISKKFSVSVGTLNNAQNAGKFKSKRQSEASQLAHDSGKYDYSVYKTESFKRKCAKNGGYKPHAGRSKGAYVQNIKKEEFWAQSSYEVRLAKLLNELDIYWIRTEGIKYVLDGVSKRYFPDFFLPDYNLYLDPKNSYLMKLDTEKIKAVSEQNSLKVLMVSEEQLTLEGVKSLLPPISK